MPFVKSLREVRVASLNGHIANIPARTATEIPAALLEEAMAKGCVVCDKNGHIVADDEAAELAAALASDEIPFLPPEERDDPAKRSRVIKLAVTKLYARNDRADFGSNNLPKANVVARMIGFQVSAAEVSEAVERLQGTDD